MKVRTFTIFSYSFTNHNHYCLFNSSRWRYNNCHEIVAESCAKTKLSYETCFNAERNISSSHKSSEHSIRAIIRRYVSIERQSINPWYITETNNHTRWLHRTYQLHHGQPRWTRGDGFRQHHRVSSRPPVRFAETPILLSHILKRWIYCSVSLLLTIQAVIILFIRCIAELNQYRTSHNAPIVHGSSYDASTWEMIKNGGPLLPSDLIFGNYFLTYRVFH